MTSQYDGPHVSPLSHALDEVYAYRVVAAKQIRIIQDLLKTRLSLKRKTELEAQLKRLWILVEGKAEPDTILRDLDATQTFKEIGMSALMTNYQWAQQRGIEACITGACPRCKERISKNKTDA